MLKNKEKILSRVVIPSVIASTGIISVLGVTAFGYSGNQYKKCEERIADKVSQITSNEEYAQYIQEQEKLYYEQYKSGDITSEQFEEKVATLSSSDYIVDSNLPCVSEEDKQELIHLNKEKMNRSYDNLAGLIAFIGGGFVSNVTLAAVLSDINKDQDLYM